MADTMAKKMQLHLVSLGIFRIPSVAGDANGDPPPLWVNPADGPQAPGDPDGTEDHPVVIATVIPATPFPTLGYSRRPVVDLTYRTRSVPRAHDLEELVTRELVGIGPQAARYDWFMADGTRVIESRQWHGLQNLGSDRKAFNFRSSWAFEVYPP